MVVERWIGSGKRGREATVHRRIQELRALREEKLANVMECKAGLLHSVGDSHSLEVASMMNIPSFAVDERVIRSWTPLVGGRVVW